MASGIYAIIHRDSGRWYVGQSKNIGKRWRVHRIDLRRGSHHSVPLQRAWDKYGEDAFDFELLILAPAWALNDLEQAYLDDPETSHFNIAKDAQASGKGISPSIETRAKMSKSHMGRKCPKSEEHRERISASLLGRKLPPRSAKHSANQSAAQLGKKRSPETIAKIVATRRANGSYAATPESTARLVAANIGRKHNPESISKRVATRRARGSYGPKCNR